jgi:REP element-mobilizing transposase RayT
LFQLNNFGIRGTGSGQEYQLKFAKDRRRWLEWLFEAKKRYGFSILDYMVTSNHVHLLVSGGKDPEVIPRSRQLIAGRTGQEYNQRIEEKLKSGNPFREDQWTESLAVGEKAFVEEIRASLGVRAIGRIIVDDGGQQQLRDSQNPYHAHFDPPNDYRFPLKDKIGRYRF